MKRTLLYKAHQKLNARLIDFGGWEMPVYYSGVIEEHQAVRNNCGLFDVSHMGIFLIQGKDSTSFLQFLLTNNVKTMDIGDALYSPMCYKDGGIVDDLVLYRKKENSYLMVVNASNIVKNYNWIESRLKGSVKVKDISSEYALLALQGPESRDVLLELTDFDPGNMKYFTFKSGKICGTDSIISRTGYTGELGYELFIETNKAVDIWNKLLESGKSKGIKPAGLGARDTLRLEKGYCLYGKDINQNHHPLEAGLLWTIDFKKNDFIGKKALQEYKEKGFPKKLIGFELKARGIPRHGYKILYNNKECGTVTSGNHSPTLSKSIGLAYVDKEYSLVGQKLEIIIRGKKIDAVVVETPFL